MNLNFSAFKKIGADLFKRTPLKPTASPLDFSAFQRKPIKTTATPLDMSAFQPKQTFREQYTIAPPIREEKKITPLIESKPFEAERYQTTLPPNYKEPGMVGQFGEAVKESTVRAVSSFGRTAQAFGIKINSQKVADAGRKFAEDFQITLAQHPEWQAPKDMGKWKDPLFYSRLVGGIVPSIAGAFGISAATTVATGGFVPAGLAAGFAYSKALEGGFAFSEAKKAGATDKRAQEVSDTVGTINGVLEMTPIGRLLVKIPGGKTIVKNVFGRVALEFVKQGITEGSTEAMQEVVNNAFQQEFDKNRGLFEGVLEAFVGGMIAGGVLGGGVEFVISPEAKAIKEDVQKLYKETGQAGFAKLPIEPRKPVGFGEVKKEIIPISKEELAKTKNLITENTQLQPKGEIFKYTEHAVRYNEETKTFTDLPLKEKSIFRKKPFDGVPEDILEKIKVGGGARLDKTELSRLGRSLSDLGYANENTGLVVKSYSGKDIILGTTKGEDFGIEYIVAGINKRTGKLETVRLHATPMTNDDIIGRTTKTLKDLSDVGEDLKLKLPEIKPTPTKPVGVGEVKKEMPTLKPTPPTLMKEARKFESAESFVDKKAIVPSLLPKSKILGPQARGKFTGEKTVIGDTLITKLQSSIDEAKKLSAVGGDGEIGNYHIDDVLKRIKNGRIKVYHGTTLEASENFGGTHWKNLNDGSYLSLTKGSGREAAGVYGAGFYKDLAEEYGKKGVVVELEIPIEHLGVDDITGELRFINPFTNKTKPQLTEIWEEARGVKKEVKPTRDTSQERLTPPQKDSKPKMDVSPEKKVSVSLPDKITIKKDLSQAKIETDKIAKLPPANTTQTIQNDWRGVFELPPETKLQSVRRVAEDFNIRLKVLNDKIENVAGNKIEEHLNLWVQKDMLPRKQSDLLRRLRDKKQDFVKRLTENKIDVESFDKYLHARHAIERNKQMNVLRAEKGNETVDGLSGMTNKEANKILAKDNKQYESFANEIYKMNDETLTFQLERGLLKPKEYEAIKGMYKDYVPLFREMDTDFIGIGRGVDIKGKEIKRAKGSVDRRVVSPIGNVFFQAEKAQVRALKNEIGKTIIELTKKHPETTDIFKIEKQQYVPRFNAEGELQFLDPKLKLGDNVIGTKIDGTQHFITIKDPKLAQALKNLNIARIPKGMQFLRSALGIWGSFKTRWRPEFLITNFQRDLGEALMNLGVEKSWLKTKGKGLRRDIVKDLFPSQKAIWKYLRGAEDKQVDEFFKLGGDAGHFWLEDINTAEKSLLQLQKEIQNIGIEKLKNPIRKTGQLADDINSMVELGIRYSTFKNLTARGFSKEKAIQSSADLTVNFSRQGELSPVMKSLYGFINPTIQGGSKVIRSLASKEGGKSVAKGVVFLAMLGFFTRLTSMLIDEEGDEQISDWNKNHKLTFSIGNGKAISLWQMPYGFTAFYAMGSNMAELMMKKKTTGEAMKNILATTVDSFSPWGTSLFDLIPTLAKPIFEVSQNIAWYDGKIYPEQIFTKTPKPDVNTYFKSATNTSKFITGFLNDITGGDTASGKAGLIDMHPDSLKYLYNQYFGGPFEFTTSSIEAGARGLDGEFEPNKTPFVRQFYRENKAQQFSYKIIYDTLERAYKKDLSKMEIDRYYRAVDIGLTEEVFDQDRASEYIRDFIKARFRVSGPITDDTTIYQISKLPKDEQELLLNTYSETTQRTLRRKLKHPKTPSIPNEKEFILKLKKAVDSGELTSEKAKRYYQLYKER